MGHRSEEDLLQELPTGDESVFTRVYDAFAEQVRLVAWKTSHRPDWLDDILNESWCRAFAQRRSYQADRPFLVWMAGIVRNVYREHCRKSPTIVEEGGADRSAVAGTGESEPEILAAQAELLSGLNECVQRLPEVDARIVRIRFFEGRTLRATAKEVGIPESTLREVRLPAILAALRMCLKEKSLDLPASFVAQGDASTQ